MITKRSLKRYIDRQVEKKINRMFWDDGLIDRAFKLIENANRSYDVNNMNMHPSLKDAYDRTKKAMDIVNKYRFETTPETRSHIKSEFKKAINLIEPLKDDISIKLAIQKLRDFLF